MSRMSQYVKDVRISVGCQQYLQVVNHMWGISEYVQDVDNTCGMYHIQHHRMNEYTKLNVGFKNVESKI